MTKTLFLGWRLATIAGAQDEKVTKVAGVSCMLKHIFILYLSIVKQLGKMIFLATLLQFFKMRARLQ